MASTIKSGSNNDLYIQTDGVDRIVVDSNGNTSIIGSVLSVENATGWGEAHLNGATGGDLILQDDGVNIGEVYAGVGHGMTVKSFAGHGINFITNNDTSKMTIDTAGRVTTPYQPAFDVASSVGVAGNSYQTFNTTYLNVGSNFGNNRFTAPVAGVYQFFATTIKGSASDTDVVRVYLHVNGTVTRGSRHVRLSEGSTYGENGVGSWLLNLSASDYVQVYIGQNSSHSNVEYTYFNGYLVG